MSLALVLALLLGSPPEDPAAPPPVAAPAVESTDGPMTTAPAPARTSPPSLASPPTDDYGYVAWCSGAVHDYLSLYERVMPEVKRIESAFPGPDGVEAALKVYPELRAQAQSDVDQFDAALAMADRASPRSLDAARADGMRRGRAIWTGASLASKARLAQTWMSWSPPGDCDTASKRLVMRSSLFGAALKGAEAPPAPAADPIADLAAGADAAAAPLGASAEAVGLKGPQ